MASHVNGSSESANSTGSILPKITLYTSHLCPFAHRAHIVLEELKLPFDEVLIDLRVPRPQWFLDINPRGLVPTIKYTVPGLFDEEVVSESGIVAQFLADSFPSHVLPASRESPTAALERARINFFVDTWTSKIASQTFPMMAATDPAVKEVKASAFLAEVEKEIEPLLANTAPFFNGSKEFTFAEVMTTSFVMRLFDASEDGVLLPKSLAEKLSELPNFGKWAKAVRQRPSALSIYDAEAVLRRTKELLAQRSAKA